MGDLTEWPYPPEQRVSKQYRLCTYRASTYGNKYRRKYRHRVFTFLLHVPYIGWLKTLGGHAHRLAEDTRGTCTQVG